MSKEKKILEKHEPSNASLADVGGIVFSSIPLDDAKSWFHVSAYKGLAKRLLKEGLTVEIESGKEYHLPFLKRYCASRNLVLLGSTKIIKKGMVCYEFLKIGKFVFSISKVDGANFHIKYKVLNENVGFQLQLF